MLWSTIQRLTREQLCMGVLDLMDDLVAQVSFPLALAFSFTATLCAQD